MGTNFEDQSPFPSMEEFESKNQLARVTLLLGTIGINGVQNGEIAHQLLEKLGVEGMKATSDDELLQLAQNSSIH